MYYMVLQHTLKTNKQKWFPSTKTCSSCGNMKNMSLSERVYSCICGVNLDRDYNAAINIKNEAIRLLALA
ncbi:zinc ribbon domain-containing protein [Bacillus cereus]|nr:zinc ribbon domain-containing protein [Bacillus cereus]MDA2303255.1 zinc ribbon domain-containing protein [Bacillus cereus]MDA2308907.1 zinc ribbon domain-containing protein [Bacillus cereus]